MSARSRMEWGYFPGRGCKETAFRGILYQKRGSAVPWASIHSHDTVVEGLEFRSRVNVQYTSVDTLVLDTMVFFLLSPRTQKFRRRRRGRGQSKQAWLASTRRNEVGCSSWKGRSANADASSGVVLPCAAASIAKHACGRKVDPNPAQMGCSARYAIVKDLGFRGIQVQLGEMHAARCWQQFLVTSQERARVRPRRTRPWDSFITCLCAQGQRAVRQCCLVPRVRRIKTSPLKSHGSTRTGRQTRPSPSPSIPRAALLSSLKTTRQQLEAG